MTSIALSFKTLFTHKKTPPPAIQKSKAKITPPQQGSLKGRKVIPASFYLMVGAAIAGTIVAVAAAVLNIIPFIVAGAVLTVVSSVGAFEIKRFAAAGTLNKVNEQTDIENQRLEASLKEANQTIDDLKKDNAAIGKNITTYEQSLKAGQAKINQQVVQIQILTNQLDAIQKKLAQAIQIDPELKKAFGDFTEASQTLQKENNDQDQLFKNFTVTLQQWRAEIAAFNPIATDIEKSLEALTTVYMKLPPLLDMLKGIIQQFSQTFKQLKQRDQDIEGKNKVLAAEASSLKASLAQLQTGASNLAQQIGDKDHQLQAVEGALKDMQSRLDTVIKAQIDPAKIGEITTLEQQILDFERNILDAKNIDPAKKNDLQARIRSLTNSINALFFHTTR